MAGIADSMADVFDYVWNRFQGRLAGLADDEYFWEPVCGCWSVRQAAGGVWVSTGRVATCRLGRHLSSSSTPPRSACSAIFTRTGPIWVAAEPGRGHWR